MSQQVDPKVKRHFSRIPQILSVQPPGSFWRQHMRKATNPQPYAQLNSSPFPAIQSLLYLSRTGASAPTLSTPLDLRWIALCQAENIALISSHIDAVAALEWVLLHPQLTLPPSLDSS